jgi:2-polyprenyl-3-methyl-5-hydroxy-6-metoxy-1,4-benzoquinol methylase
MDYYISKSFDEFGLSDVDYLKCKDCGFCASETHFEMTDKKWSDLNDKYHSASHLRTDNPYNRNQRYFNQALMLSLAARKNIIGKGSWLDWGCGIGKVSMLLDELFGTTLKTYDKYYSPHINEIAEDELVSRSFDLVLNTAVFEHVRSRLTLDEIESYVAEGG